MGLPENDHVLAECDGVKGEISNNGGEKEDKFNFDAEKDVELTTVYGVTPFLYCNSHKYTYSSRRDFFLATFV
jgi:hypothetical protein